MRKIKRYPKQEGTNFMLNYTDIIILNYTTLFVNHLFFQANIIIRMKALHIDLNYTTYIACNKRNVRIFLTLHSNRDSSYNNGKQCKTLSSMLQKKLFFLPRNAK